MSSYRLHYNNMVDRRFKIKKKTTNVNMIPHPINDFGVHFCPAVTNEIAAASQYSNHS